MNATARGELWGRLQNTGLVYGDVPDTVVTPWYVRVMLGIAGWIGALFILGFVGVGFEMVMRSAGAALVAATMCCGGAYAIFRAAPTSDFANQFGLATGLAGQALFCVAIFQHFHSDVSAGFFLMCAVETTLTLFMPNFVHRIFTTLAAVVALTLGFEVAGLHGLALPISAAGCAFVWCGEWRMAERTDIWQPVGYGLALGLLQTASTSILGGEILTMLHRDSGGWLQQHGPVIGSALIAVVFLAVTVHILRELEIDPSDSTGIVILVCATLVMGVSFFAHGLAAAAIILILGFAGGNRVLFGLGMLALVLFLSHYYYQMHDTLLIKSLILGSTGALLLAVRWALRKLFPQQGANDHA